MSTKRSQKQQKRQQRRQKKVDRRPQLSVVPAEPESCDCPMCVGADADPAAMVGELFGALLGSADGLADCADALDAELAGAAWVAMPAVLGDLAPAFVEELVAKLEANADEDALALLRAVGSVALGVKEQVATVASTAADRLAATGVPEPRWSGELAEPVLVGDCVRLHDGGEVMSVLAATFRRAGHEHSFVVLVDEEEDGAARHVLLAEPQQLSQVLEDARAGARADGLDVRTQALDPAEWRWYAEEALHARDVLDEVNPDVPGWEELEDEAEDPDAPPYPVLAQLLRARLAALPQARGLEGARERRRHSAPGVRQGTSTSSAELLAGRAKAVGAASIYQLKVGLRGARPPIWRRLQVSADLSLAELNAVIQVAFGWDGSHLHVFETPYGEFGQPDRELGHRPETRVTLEQVAAHEGAGIRYTYDFGDNWLHEIVVEKVLDRDPALTYPICTAGRRAAPPDDCGGLWAYGELVSAFADPARRDHADARERLEWLVGDLDSFDPATFDRDEVNQVLAALRVR